MMRNFEGKEKGWRDLGRKERKKVLCREENEEVKDKGRGGMRGRKFCVAKRRGSTVQEREWKE